MTGAGLLVAAGGVIVLAGLVLLAASLLGLPLGGARDRGRRRHPVTVRPVWLAAAAAGVLALLLTGWVPLAAAAAAVVLILPSLLGSSGAERQIERLEALSTWIRRLSDLLASGAAGSLEAALRRSADTAPTSIAAEVALLASRMGPQGMRAALLGFARDVADPAADQVVMALVLQLRHGGRGLARVLAGLADDVHDQTRMRREIEADRAKPRSNVRVLVILTLALAVGMIVFAHAFLAPYGTAEGQLALTAVVAVFLAALLWLQHMVRQAPGQRLLIEDDFTDIRPAPEPASRRAS